MVCILARSAYVWLRSCVCLLFKAAAGGRRSRRRGPGASRRGPRRGLVGRRRAGQRAAAPAASERGRWRRTFRRSRERARTARAPCGPRDAQIHLPNTAESRNATAHLDFPDPAVAPQYPPEPPRIAAARRDRGSQIADRRSQIARSVAERALHDRAVRVRKADALRGVVKLEDRVAQRDTAGREEMRRGPSA